MKPYCVTELLRDSLTSPRKIMFFFNYTYIVTFSLCDLGSLGTITICHLASSIVINSVNISNNSKLRFTIWSLIKILRRHLLLLSLESSNNFIETNVGKSIFVGSYIVFTNFHIVDFFSKNF